MQNNFSKCREWVPRGTSQHKWRWLTTLLLILTLGIGQMWADPAAMYANSFEGGTDSWGKSSMTSGPAEETTNVRTGGKSIKYVSSASLGYTTKSVSFVKNTKIHAILWVKASETKSVYLSLNSNNGTAVNVGSAGWTKVAHTYSYTSSTGNKNVRLYMNDKTANVSIYVDDVIMYSDAADTIDFTKPTAATLPNATTTSLSWTNGSDGAKGTGIQNTLIWKRTTSGTNNLSLNDQGVYAVNDVNGQWTLVNASVAGDETSYSGTFVSGEEYAIVHRDYAYNYSTPLYVTIPGGGGGGGDPVDPVFTYTPATYTIGDDPLDLSTKLSSTNTTGAITFAVSSTDAGTTGASIANSKNFTATTAGTAKVTVSQAASTGFNAKSQDIDVTVVAPDPCHKYFWFAKADDVPTGITNNENSFFGSTPGGSGSMTASITIDEVQYNITGRSSNATPNISFTVPANKSGKLYVVAQGSSNRSLVLKKGTTTIQTISWTTAKGDEFNPVGPGEYSLTCTGGNVGWGMLAVKVCDAEFHTITLDLDGGTGATSVQALDGAAATKPADPTKEHCTFAGWYKGADEYDWTTAVTTPFTLTAHWTQLYTVTYAAGDGTATGDAPTQADLAAGEKFNVAANTFAVAGKDFVKWNDGTSDYNPGQEYTMGSANVTLTAQWKAASAKYTVHYMDEDGTTPLAADELVEVTQKPAGLAEDPTKPLYTFAAWQLSGVDIALDATSWTSVPANTEVTLTARWAKAYAANIDFEAFIDANTTSGNWQNYLSTNNYAISNTADVSLDNQGTSKPADKGLKMKNHPGAYVSFNVNAGKLVLVKMGRVNGMDASVDGGANYAALNGSGSSEGASVINYLYNASEAEYRLKTTVNGYNIIQSITITDPYTVTFNANGGEDVASMNGTPSVILPSATKGTDSFLGWFDAAVGGNKIGEAGESYIPSASIELFAHWEAISTDARLASITFSSNSGTLSPAFNPEVVNYTYTMPYKTAAIPTITGATSVNANAQDPIIGDAAAAWGDAQTIKGVAESGDKKTYTITMKVAPKDGVSIIETKVTSQNNHGPVGGLIGGDAAVKNASTFKLNTGNYVGVTLAGSNKFQAGDVVAINVTNAENATGFTLYTTNDADSALIVDTRASAVVSTGIHYVTIPATYADGVTPYEGTSSIYLLRADNTTTGNMNPRVDSIAVLRAMNPVLKSITFDGTKINVTSTTVSETLPYGTDLAVVTPEIVWNGAGTAVVTTNSGNWAWGENTYVLTDKDGDVTTYTITLTEAEHYVAQIGTTGYTSLAAAVDAAQADDVVKLLDNVDLMSTGLTIAENITLDLNGFNIKAGEQIDNDILVPAGKKLTLVDNSANAEGKIYTEQAYTGAVTGYGLIRVAGELLMQSGNIYAVIESDPANLGQFAVVLGAGGKATIEGGQIKAGWYAISNNGNNTGSTIIVSGGELISTADFAIYNPAKESTVTVSGGVVYGAAGGIAMNRGELTVTGGTITSKDQGTTGTWGDGTGGLSNAAISANGKYESVSVEISGGTVTAEGNAIMITNGTTNPVEIAISGGQFSHVVPAEYCADGFAPVTEPNAQGKYEVEDKRIYIFNGITSSSSMATSPSGAISWAKVGDTMGEASKSGTYDEVNYVKALQLKNSSTTKHFRIDVDINNSAKIEVIGMSNDNSETRHAWLTNSTDKGEIANAIASLTTTGYNPEMFATDWLEEGSYYLHADNTVNIFLIRVTAKAVDPKCEVPTITTQPATNLTFGAGDMTATVEAEVSDEGTLTYQWYNAANDEAVLGQTTATLTTAVEGTYYVIVTNTKASHRDNSIKSDEAQLAHRVMNDATLSALSVSAGTLAPAFDPAVENYTVNLAMGTTVVPTLTATATMNGYANVAKNEATEFVNYEAVSTVVVTSEDLSATKTYTVHYYVAHQITTLVDVTESTVWDWTTITARADGSVIDQTIGNKQYGPSVATADGLILANYVLGGDNWDKIEGNDGAYAIRSSSNQFYQGASLHFHSTKGGYLTIRARNEGHDMILKVQNAGRDMNLGDLGDWKNYVIYVKAGDVVIYNVPASSNYPMRVAKITFTEDETPDYPRVVTNNFGTLCVDHNVVAGGALGATFYQIASRNELYNDKIDFEEVLPGEELKAGEPYIFQSTTGTIELYYGETVKAQPVEVRGMIGSFVDAHVDIDESNKSDILYIANNRLWNCEDMVGSYLEVVANRAYIVMSDVPTYAEYTATPQQGNAPRRRVTLGKDAQQNATGLENLVGGEQAQKLIIDGQMYILRGEKLYDATGRLVK